MDIVTSGKKERSTRVVVNLRLTKWRLIYWEEILRFLPPPSLAKILNIGNHCSSVIGIIDCAARACNRVCNLARNRWLIKPWTARKFELAINVDGAVRRFAIFLVTAVGRIFFFSIINLFACIKIFFIDTSNTSRLNFNWDGIFVGGRRGGDDEYWHIRREVWGTGIGVMEWVAV